jgi:hypothetical protein
MFLLLTVTDGSTGAASGALGGGGTNEEGAAAAADCMRLHREAGGRAKDLVLAKIFITIFVCDEVPVYSRGTTITILSTSKNRAATESREEEEMRDRSNFNKWPK